VTRRQFLKWLTIMPYAFQTQADFNRARRSIHKTEREAQSTDLPRGASPALREMAYLCKNSGTTWAKGTTRDVNVYTLPAGVTTQGSETDSGQTLTAVYNRLGDIPANAWLYVFPINGDKLEVWNATC